MRHKIKIQIPALMPSIKMNPTIKQMLKKLKKMRGLKEILKSGLKKITKKIEIITKSFLSVWQS